MIVTKITGENREFKGERQEHSTEHPRQRNGSQGLLEI